jgi:hypothetical protein
VSAPHCSTRNGSKSSARWRHKFDIPIDTSTAPVRPEPVLFLDRRLAGGGTGLSVELGVRGNTTNGRQDKSAAFGRAQVVGWVGFFERPGDATDSGPCQFPNYFNTKTDITHHFKEGRNDGQS